MTSTNYRKRGKRNCSEDFSLLIFMIKISLRRMNLIYDGYTKKNNLSMTVCYHVSDKNEYL